VEGITCWLHAHHAHVHYSRRESRVLQRHTIASPIALLLDVAQSGCSTRDPTDLGRGVNSDVGASVGGKRISIPPSSQDY
jgi:hypothetical protein